ncbi:NADH-quinone oxidoreductase subunit K [Alkalilacustris brevis]|uniref:NADH-quinone oxidoreductase subunit K n=1 Tax=Alkalilacustris brevis TaxID=2026338 RepID=UPI000E0DB949|nr:NADH-quinone oxidoreductase subunit K [Alkalilacustris brevis]
MIAPATIYGLCGAALVGLGLYGFVTRRGLLRRVLAFNVIGSGVFLYFGAAAARGARDGIATDPVPQAMIITGIVVALSATALAVALVVAHAKAGGGHDRLPEDEPRETPAGKDGPA